MAPSLVQVAAGQASASSVTVTLGTATTAGNCLIVAATGADIGTNKAVTGVTLGGAAGNFAALVASVGTGGTTAAFLDLWADPNCAGGQTSVAITWSGVNSHGVAAFVYEFSGLAAASILDQSSTNFTTSTNPTFSSGTTATTTQASELWFGAVGGFNTTITGPSSPWVNSSQIATGDGTRDLMAGYRIVSATGTASYAGSYSPNSFEESAVVALKAAAGKGGGYYDYHHRAGQR